jgi:hypothetical protein
MTHLALEPGQFVVHVLRARPGRLRRAGRGGPLDVGARQRPAVLLIVIAVGILIAFLVVGSVIGAIFHVLTDLVIAALVVGGIVAAVKIASSRRQVSGSKAEREVRDRDDNEQYSRPLPRADVEPARNDVDDDLARLKREMGS